MMNHNALLNVAVEGKTDSVVVSRLLAWLEIQHAPINVAQGINRLLPLLPKYHAMSKLGWGWFILIDLDNRPCPVDWLNEVAPSRADTFHLRIVVRAIESWLLADQEAFARFFRIKAINRIPATPDDEMNPKNTVIQIIRNHGTHQSIKKDMLPPQGGTAKVGPGYMQRISDYALHHWRPDVALNQSDSLRRSIAALERWKGQT